jgi:hypothetical protein
MAVNQNLDKDLADMDSSPWHVGASKHSKKEVRIWRLASPNPGTLAIINQLDNGS